MVKAPEKEPGPGKPKIFLGLATLMVVIAGLAYAFEDWLYTVRPLSPYSTNQLNTYFIGILVLSVILALFFSFNRFPKLDIVGEDLDAVTAPETQCFQGFCIEREPGSNFYSRWWTFSVTYLRLVAVGMTFAFLVAGLAEAFLFPRVVSEGFQPKAYSSGRCKARQLDRC